MSSWITSAAQDSMKAAPTIAVPKSTAAVISETWMPASLTITPGRVAAKAATM